MTTLFTAKTIRTLAAAAAVSTALVAGSASAFDFDAMADEMNDIAEAGAAYSAARAHRDAARQAANR